MSWGWCVSAALGAIGLAGLIYKKTMLGIIASIQVMVLGVSILFILASGAESMRTDGHSFAIFIVIGGLAQTIGGYALATRLFYLKNRSSLADLRNLKR